MQADIASLNEGQATLEASQDALTAKVNRMDVRQDAIKEDIKDLKAGQAAIAHDIKEISEQTRDLVEFEAETRLNFDKASKKLDSFQRVTAQNTFKHHKIRNPFEFCCLYREKNREWLGIGHSRLFCFVNSIKNGDKQVRTLLYIILQCLNAIGGR